MLTTTRTLAISVGFAIVALVDRPEAQLAAGGKAAPGQFSHVAMIRAGNNFCTAVLVAGRVMLTAFHCVPDDNVSVTVTTADWTNNPAAHLCGKSAELDLAVIRLDRAPQRTNATLAEIPASALIDRTTRVTMVGFGDTGNPNNRGNGFGRFATASIGRITDAEFKTNGSSQPCQGDSGGPAFANGPTKLVGIASFVDDITQCGSAAHYVRVDRTPAARWIRESVAECSR